MNETVRFERVSLSRRVRSMLRVDFRRMLRSRLFYIILAAALLVPVVMTVMLTMMDGQESTDPQTGKVTVMEGPESVWESFGTLPADPSAPPAEAPSDDAAGAMGGMGDMSVMAMCNINMAFMGVAVFVCLFISEDFRSGYAKNLFTVRARRGEYVASKILAGFVCGALMLLLYTLGAILAGAITGLSFELVGDMTVAGLVMCLFAKILLMLVFVSIFTVISVAAKQTAWLSICASLGGGMLLFMMIPMITPLTSTPLHVVLCAAGGAAFAFGLGAIGRIILKKTSLV